MRQYLVLYRIESNMHPFYDPFGFSCMAEDIDHAEEQCKNAYPDCRIVWVYADGDYRAALDNYYSDFEE